MDGVLTVDIADNFIDEGSVGSTRPAVRVSGIKNSKFPKAYIFRHYLQTGGTILERGETTFTVNSRNIPTLTFQPLAYTVDTKMSVYVSFDTQTELPDGYFV